MTTDIIAHSTVPSTRISRELALTIGASPSPLTLDLGNKVIVAVNSTCMHVSSYMLHVYSCIFSTGIYSNSTT